MPLYAKLPLAWLMRFLVSLLHADYFIRGAAKLRIVLSLKICGILNSLVPNVSLIQALSEARGLGMKNWGREIVGIMRV